MTINEVINIVKAIKSPTVEEQDLLRVINETEAEVWTKIVHPRRAGEYTPYTEEDRDKTLLAPTPFDNIYVLACVRYIDMLENQPTNYNNSERAYKEAFDSFAAFWTRTHRPDCAPNVHSRLFGV